MSTDEVLCLCMFDFSHPLNIIDILATVLFIAGFFIYIRKFPIFRVFLGLLFLFVCSVIFYLGRLYLTASLFAVLSTFILVSLPLIFSLEIRRYLEKLGRLSFLKFPQFSEKQKNEAFIRQLTDAVYELAGLKIGATIVIARRTGLGETVDTGVQLDARFSPKILQSIFFPRNILHDGAVVIKDERVVAAACLLPISSEVKLSLGTRHRSAVSITRDTDAVVVVVSEEKGVVSIAENGKLEIDLDRVEFTQKLQKLLV